MKGNDDNYEVNLFDLVDRYSIFKIKEIRFKDSEAITKEIVAIEDKISAVLSKKEIMINGDLISKLIVIALTNFEVWDLKERLDTESELYFEHLEHALELNIIRNHYSNKLMKDFNEFDISREKVTSLHNKTIEEKKWYKTFMNSFNR